MTDANLLRVRGDIGQAVVQFLRGRLESTGTFFGDDLRDYVASRTTSIAPASPDRILRDLRQRGAIDYEVISRSSSFYRVKSVSVT